jgi:hypothetical protein
VEEVFEAPINAYVELFRFYGIPAIAGTTKKPED